MTTKKKRFVFVFMIAAVAVLLLTVLAINLFPQWYYNHNACEVIVNYNNIDGTELKYIDAEENFDSLTASENQILYTQRDTWYLVKLPGNGKSFRIPFYFSDKTIFNAPRINNIAGAYKNGDTYYFVVRGNINSYAPATNKNQHGDYLMMYGNERDDIFTVNSTEKYQYIIYGTNSELHYFDSADKTVHCRKLKDDANDRIVFSCEDVDKYHFEETGSKIYLNGKEIIELY